MLGFSDRTEGFLRSGIHQTFSQKVGQNISSLISPFWASRVLCLPQILEKMTARELKIVTYWVSNEMISVVRWLKVSQFSPIAMQRFRRNRHIPSFADRTQELGRDTHMFAKWLLRKQTRVNASAWDVSTKANSHFINFSQMPRVRCTTKIGRRHSPKKNFFLNKFSREEFWNIFCVCCINFLKLWLILLFKFMP